MGKEFDKWLNNYTNECSDCTGCDLQDVWEEGAKEGWKAALGWVLDYCSGQTEDLRDDIIEELNDG
jgi:hypothetical protein